jgi:hypothetical protein
MEYRGTIIEPSQTASITRQEIDLKWSKYGLVVKTKSLPLYDLSGAVEKAARAEPWITTKRAAKRYVDNALALREAQP